MKGACMVVRRSLYRELCGVGEFHAAHYQDVDFYLRLRNVGYRILFMQRAKLVHREGASRSDHYDVVDPALLVDVWGETIAQGDPG